VSIRQDRREGGARTWRSPSSRTLAAALVLLGAAASVPAEAATPLPPKPARWLTDEAGVLAPTSERAIDQKLEAFDHEQGTQVLVAIFRSLPPDESLEEWTQRVAQSWGVGRARQDDGAVLFAFVDDRALRIEVGYGLEGTLTDLESKAILDDVLIPRLRRGDWNGGIDAATDALIAAVRGEYQPDFTARRASSPAPQLSGKLLLLLFVVFVLFVVLTSRASRRSGWRGGGWGGGGLGGGGFGGFRGGGGFGGFSGGGGSFGGGGASGRW